MSLVILVRPGHTDFDEQHRIQGQLDLPLNERGRRHVHEVAERLRAEELDVILTGPGEPARSTAELLGQALDVPVKEKEELQNLDQGLWQGLPLDEVRRKYPKLLRAWHDEPETICPPEGEPICRAVGRLREGLRKPLKKYRRVLIVAAEPLATLIGGLVRGTKPEFSGPLCSHSGPCVEWIGEGVANGASCGLPIVNTPTVASQVNGTVLPSHPVNGEAVHGATVNENSYGVNGSVKETASVGRNGGVGGNGTSGAQRVAAPNGSSPNDSQEAPSTASPYPLA